MIRWKHEAEGNIVFFRVFDRQSCRVCRMQNEEVLVMPFPSQSKPVQMAGCRGAKEAYKPVISLSQQLHYSAACPVTGTKYLFCCSSSSHFTLSPHLLHLLCRKSELPTALNSLSLGDPLHFSVAGQKPYS